MNLPRHPSRPTCLPRFRTPLFGVLLLLSALGAQAQNFPIKPIRLVVGFAPGGSTDKLARVLSKRMGELLGQSVVVENRPGAAGNLAAEVVASATADGYTLFMTTLSSQAINPHIYSKLRFDPVKSFEPISLVAKYPLLLVVAPQLKLNSVQELIAYVKKADQQSFFSSAGTGSPAHLAGEMFKARTGANLQHVPYKGGSPALLAVMSNEAQFAFETIPSALGQTRGGKLKPLAVSSDKRSSAAPELPTLQEEGLQKFVVTSWAGLVAPAGTPRDLLDKLNQATQQALNTPTVHAALVADGAEPAGSSSAEFARFLAQEFSAWGDVVRTAQIKLD
ncbi:MAG: tripartite tricarboxylate transporter substrate binding protein [Comamonas sp.]|jgi:tripartite-type tricarboxylate transporter receptor subunit TctC|uniref:Bug family tripartite tricarboxylate transporter substrate binding protein n=1 Tax=Comamonas sp. TaxID=34028 RepID=UPI002817FC92|nr:tripartite tricarboxylate transporter substrate binding protein [Comamonas sp.]MDR0216330.1 tripartite tricarboxylate transporter substrate binding protein [Comamonas sp.]